MGIIKDDKLTKFEESLVRAMLTAKTQVEALEKSLYKTDNMTQATKYRRAHEILSRERVAKKHKELQKAARVNAESKSLLKNETIIKNLNDIIEGKITDIAEIVTKRVPIKKKGRVLINDQGEVATEEVTTIRVKDTSEMSEKTLNTINEIGMGKYGIYVKRHNKLKAIDQATRILGMYNDNVNVNIKDSTKTLSDTELEEEIKKLSKELGIDVPIDASTDD